MVLTLANRLWIHFQQHGPSQASGSSFQSHASHGHSAIGPVVSSPQPTSPGPAPNDPLPLSAPLVPAQAVSQDTLRNIVREELCNLAPSLMAFSTQGQGQDSITIPPPQHPLMALPFLPQVQHQALPQSQPELHVPAITLPLQSAAAPMVPRAQSSSLPPVSLQPSTGMLPIIPPTQPNPVSAGSSQVPQVHPTNFQGSHLSSIATQSPDVIASQPSVPLQKRLPALTHHLYEEIKKRDFVDFNDLLQENLYGLEQSHVTCHHVTIAVDSGSNGQSVSLVPSRPRKRKVVDFNSWLDAWNTYMRVFIYYHPHMLNPLLAYQSIICNFSHKFRPSDWLNYDLAFRWQASINHVLQWDSYDEDAYDSFLRDHGISSCYGCGKPGHFLNNYPAKSTGVHPQAPVSLVNLHQMACPPPVGVRPQSQPL